MAAVHVKELIASGMHFGHRTSRWNPKMAPYIFGKRNLIHIIDLKETIKGMIRARRFVSRVATRGDHVLFVGTKRAARHAIEREAKRAGCPYVAERWLGGCLTNFRTVRSRLARLIELERLEASGEIATYSKKMIAALRRERRKMTRNLDGIRTLDRLPGGVVVVDPSHEHIVMREAEKLGIPTIGLLDTDSDPDCVSVPVPGNDDAMRSIEIFLTEMAESVLEGKARRAAQPPAERERPTAAPAPAARPGPGAEPAPRRPPRGRGRGPRRFDGPRPLGPARGGPPRPAAPTPGPRPAPDAGQPPSSAPPKPKEE